jgi:hypothetical protein
MLSSPFCGGVWRNEYSKFQEKIVSVPDLFLRRTVGKSAWLAKKSGRPRIETTYPIRNTLGKNAGG